MGRIVWAEGEYIPSDVSLLMPVTGPVTEGESGGGWAERLTLGSRAWPTAPTRSRFEGCMIVGDEQRLSGAA